MGKQTQDITFQGNYVRSSVLQNRYTTIKLKLHDTIQLLRRSLCRGDQMRYELQLPCSLSCYVSNRNLQLVLFE